MAFQLAERLMLLDLICFSERYNPDSWSHFFLIKLYSEYY